MNNTTLRAYSTKRIYKSKVYNIIIFSLHTATLQNNDKVTVFLRSNHLEQKRQPSKKQLPFHIRQYLEKNYSLSKSMFIISHAALATDVPGPKIAATPAL